MQHQWLVAEFHITLAVVGLAVQIDLVSQDLSLWILYVGKGRTSLGKGTQAYGMHPNNDHSNQ